MNTLISLRNNNVFKELNINIKPMVINTDNKATIYNCKNETINPKSKHKDIKYHHIRYLVREYKIDPSSI